MASTQNLIKYEWSNDIPFNIDKVKNTLHAMLGEDKPSMVLGLLSHNKQKNKWDLNCLNPDCNETFGSYAFGQVNSSFSITVTKTDENTTKLSIDVMNRQGGMYSNQAYLQSECNKFNKALGYYLEHQDEVEDWYTNIKPNSIQQNANNGCALFIPLIIGAGSGLFWLFS